MEGDSKGCTAYGTYICVDSEVSYVIISTKFIYKHHSCSNSNYIDSIL